jgi:hypothetical protein
MALVCRAAVCPASLVGNPPGLRLHFFAKR